MNNALWRINFLSFDFRTFLRVLRTLKSFAGRD